ncbi:MAG: shikimate dehydrogenase [Desulfobacterales bacterium]
MKIDQHTDLYGVIGSPIVHSLSPAMHNAAFAAIGRNAVYLAFEAKDIIGCVRGMKALGVNGLSVTIPHKTSILPLLDEIDEMAQQIGAVNTIVNVDGRLSGYNTDAFGALKALKEKTALPGKTCLLIGAGGAARAVGFALQAHGVHLFIVNRSKKRGLRLAHHLGVEFVPLQDIETVPTDLLIQTTPIGMYPGADQSLVPLGALKEGMVVMDVIYNPVETRLLAEASSRGCATISGLTMFVHQGAEQFRLWTGKEAPLGVMTKAAEQALNQKW